LSAIPLVLLWLSVHPEQRGSASWLQNKKESLPSAYTGNTSDNDAQKIGSLAKPDVQRPTVTATVISAKTVPITPNTAHHEGEALVQPLTKDIHFIHIPKCGGTTMTTLLRQIQCHADPVANADCCLNPGFCDWHAHRRCSTIKGCINHFPQRKFIYKPMHSISLFREPISRILSAFFYRGHSPNLDFFQVRPEFKLIKEGKLPRVSFKQYIEMPEYQNIQTRMLGADSFPYRNVTVTDEVFERAVDAVQHLFFVGLQEEFTLTAQTLLRKVNASIPYEVKKERDQKNEKLDRKKSDLRADGPLMQRAREVNRYDVQLYAAVVRKFCDQLRSFPDLYEEVLRSKKVRCPAQDS